MAQSIFGSKTSWYGATSELTDASNAFLNEIMNTTDLLVASLNFSNDLFNSVCLALSTFSLSVDWTQSLTFTPSCIHYSSQKMGYFLLYMMMSFALPI